MNYAEKIVRTARENIGSFHDAGFGLYSIQVVLDNFLSSAHEKHVVLQVYPYPKDDFYGDIYLLFYYEFYDCYYEHNDVSFSDLDENAQEIVFNALNDSIRQSTGNKKQICK